MSLSTRGIRISAVMLACTTAFYLPWVWSSLNWRAPWLAWPFLFANLLVGASACVTAWNNWHRSRPEPRFVSRGNEPNVAIIIPTYGETPAMVQATVESVLEQDWPIDRMAIIVSDDARNHGVERMLDQVRIRYRACVYYHVPPLRSDPARRGDAKAGNLNAALDFVLTHIPDAQYVETRDCDDEVGDRTFLRQAVGQLEADERTAFVQTIKEARVSPKDPFGNRDALFYRGSMLARHAANAVFPCGSGLVWRRDALVDIGGFPAWNLVEDLQSGVEALRRGWRSVYLPIVGAVAQTAPEDIPNFYKQRGTWALDTVRLMLWADHDGLSLRQRLHFIELGLFYLQSVALVIFIFSPAVGLVFDVYPLNTTQAEYAIHFWPFVITIEVLLVALNSGNRYEHLWHSRQLWAGLAPVYLKACVLAVIYGPHRKPSYRVTRKDVQVSWYWRETLPQVAAVALIGASMAIAVGRYNVLTTLDLGSAYWASLQALLLLGFLPRSWHGLDWRSRSGERNAALVATTPAVRDPSAALWLVEPLTAGEPRAGSVSLPRSRPRTIVLPDGREVMNRRRPSVHLGPPNGVERRRAEVPDPLPSVERLSI